MKFKEFLDKAFFYLSVPKCVSCKERLSTAEIALCDTCLKKADEASMRECPICLKPTSLCLCINAHLESHFVKSHIKLYKYRADENSNPYDALVYAVKRGEREDLFDFLAVRLGDAVIKNEIKLDNAIITNVPRRRAAILRFGIDHAKLLAQRVAKRLCINYVGLLTSKAKTAQKALKGAERIVNTDYSVSCEMDLSGKRVIILDDIVTTGASMGSAATMIRSMGAKEIYALSVGYAYKNKKS